MSRLRLVSGRVAVALGASLLALALAACDDDGKTAPARCLDPALPLFDPINAGAPGDDNEQYPCVTPVGHSVTYVGAAPVAMAGTSSGGTGTAGTQNSAQGGADGGAADGGAGS